MRSARLRRAAAALLAFLACGVVPTAGGARSAADPSALRPVSGSGTLHFRDADTDGTATTRVIPAAIKPGEPVRFVVEVTWTVTDKQPTCSSPSGTVDAQTSEATQVPLATIRPGHGEDLLAPLGSDPPATGTNRQGPNRYECGPPNRTIWQEAYDVRVSGTTTSRLAPGCYAPFPSAGGNAVSYIAASGTYDGTFATLSVGGVDCTTASEAAPAFTDSFSTSGQSKPHAVSVPAKKTRAVVTIRWSKRTDRFTLARVALAAKRKTQAAGRSTKLKIVFTSLGLTGLQAQISGLTPGKLSFHILGQKVTGPARVTTKVVLKA